MAVRWEQTAERSMEVASKVSPLAGAKGPGGLLATCSKQQPHRDRRTESLLKAAGLVGHLLWGHWAAAAQVLPSTHLLPPPGQRSPEGRGRTLALH